MTKIIKFFLQFVLKNESFVKNLLTDDFIFDKIFQDKIFSILSAATKSLRRGEIYRRKKCKKP